MKCCINSSDVNGTTQPVMIDDWTEQVRADLVLVGIPATLQFLTSKSRNVFKEVVKNKIKAFEFSTLMQERGSKTANLKYSHLRMQDYLLLENMSKNQAIALFKFRTRMAPFAENFRAGKFDSACPLCLSHLDSQEESFSCTAMKKVLEIRGTYSDIFTNNFSEDLINTLDRIYNYRKEFSEKK